MKRTCISFFINHLQQVTYISLSASTNVGQKLGDTEQQVANICYVKLRSSRACYNLGMISSYRKCRFIENLHENI